MNEIEKDVLNRLINKYEKSVISKQGSERDLKIRLTRKDGVLKRYDAFDSAKYTDELDETLGSLERKGYIDVVRKYGAFDHLSLCIPQVDDIYKYLKREKRDDVNDMVLNLLDTYDWSGLNQEFKSCVVQNVNAKFTWPKKYFDDIEQLRLICKALDAISKLTENIMERDFSISVFHDSKVFFSIKGKVALIIRDFSGVEYEGDDDILADNYIIKNSTYVLIKGTLSFKLGKQHISLNDLGYEYSLSDKMIEDIIIAEEVPSKVITVENLTTFYKVNEPNALIVYLSGFHNHTRQNLLKKIYKKYPNIKYYHFGDIDVGGMRIFNNLLVKTGIPFEPYYMSMLNMQAKSNYTKPLTDNDRQRLSNMLLDYQYALFHETIKWMLENNLKLEQEAFDLDF